MENEEWGVRNGKMRWKYKQEMVNGNFFRFIVYNAE